MFLCGKSGKAFVSHQNRHRGKQPSKCHSGTTRSNFIEHGKPHAELQTKPFVLGWGQGINGHKMKVTLVGEA